MKLYIDNLIPRVKEFSANLDKKEIFVEKPWVIIDEELNLQKYIFRRNGELVMSKNGQVLIGKWEYIPAAKSLLIDRVSDKILLNQNFIDPAVMILKRDGFHEENFILANESLLPDLNVTNYLKKLYYQKNSIAVVKLKSGIDLELLNYNGAVVKNKVSIDGESVPDTVFEHAEFEKKYVIKDSRIYKILVKGNYQTNLGIITIEQEQYYEPLIGDSVFQNGLPAPNGKYKIGFMTYLHVENGNIIRTSRF